MAAEPTTDQLALGARDAFVRFWSSWHEAVYRVTEGRILNRLMGMTVVQLTTIGRRTGLARSTMLTAPIAEEGLVVLVASNGGDERDPQWFKNLQAHPEVEVAVDGISCPMLARVATGPERAELWRRIRRAGPTYHLYQRHTDRQLPIVVLDPVEAGTGG